MIGRYLAVAAAIIGAGCRDKIDSASDERVRLPDEERAYSPDSVLVAFPRKTSARPDYSADEETDPRELWIAARNGSHPRRLLAARPDTDFVHRLDAFASVTFSGDGQRIYFLSRLPAASWALHVYDLNTNTERYVRSAVSVEVIPRGEFAGCLLLADHTVRERGGAVYPHAVTTAEGTEIVAIGDEEGDDDPKLIAWRRQHIPSALSEHDGLAAAPHDPRCM